MSRTLALVVAHPDDDAYGAAGTVALHAADPGFRFVLIHATDGARGQIPDGFPATPGTLGGVRRVEDEHAWRALGRAPDRHEWLGHEDGSVADVPHAELTDTVAAILAEEVPDVVITFGPDGMTGHPDHVAIGAATGAAFERLAGGGRSFRRLLHGGLPQSVFDRWNAGRERRGLPVWDPDEVYHLRAVPDDTIGAAVDVSAVALRIVAGLREHRSQAQVLGGAGLTDHEWARLVGREHYVVAWPPGERGLTDVFEGL